MYTRRTRIINYYVVKTTKDYSHVAVCIGEFSLAQMTEERKRLSVKAGTDFFCRWRSEYEQHSAVDTVEHVQ